MKGIQAALRLGQEPAQAAEAARAARDPAILVAAIPRLDDTEKALRDLKTSDEDGKRLVPAFSALADYRQAIGAGDYRRRLHLASGGELAALAEAINQMARGIEAQIATITDQKVQLQAILDGMPGI